MQSIGDAPAYYKRAKRLHRAAYHRSLRLTPERKARFVAESITLKQDEGRAWSWSDYGLEEQSDLQHLVLQALKALQGEGDR
jgi:hypothetical protein